MKISKKYKYHEQFPNRGAWDVLHPSYLTIGGSGVIGTGGSESPMSNHEMQETPSEEAAENVSMNSGSGEAAGTAATGTGSGVA
jgi:hypothetical protein